MIRLALADDHQLVLDGLKALIKEVEEFEFVAEASNGKQLLEIVKSLPLDVILVDVDMPIMNGLQAIKEIQRVDDKIKCIALTMHNDPSMVKKALNAGAQGYLLKNIDQEDLINSIKKVATGVKVVMDGLEEGSTSASSKSPAFVNPVLNNFLTEREAEILRLIANGLSNKEIGDKLFISHRTVDTHRTNLMKKLEVHNIAGLIRYAIQNGYAE